jgi:hypothetical protein
LQRSRPAPAPALVAEAGSLTHDLSAGGWGFCKVCRCAWKAEAINGTVYACNIEGPIHTKPRVPNRQLTEADYDGHDELR